jgi:hypothetical protein
VRLSGHEGDESAASASTWSGQDSWSRSWP